MKLFAEFTGWKGAEMGFEGSGPGDCVGLVGEVEVKGLETVVGVDVVDWVTTLFGLNGADAFHGLRVKVGCSMRCVVSLIASGAYSVVELTIATLPMPPKLLDTRNATSLL